LNEKRRKFLEETFVRKDIRGDLKSRAGIGAKELSTGGRDATCWWADFKYLELNMVDKNANEYGGILGSNVHNEDI